MSVDEIRARWAGVVWQRSKFVDGPRYADKPPEWKQAMQNIEQHIIRGPGAVGSPSCNMVMAVHDFDDATTPERVAAAPADIRTLLAAYGAAIAERDKYKAMCLGETYGDLDELRADVLRLVKDHVTLTAERDAAIREIGVWAKQAGLAQAERDALKARVEELEAQVRGVLSNVRLVDIYNTTGMGELAYRVGHWTRPPQTAQLDSAVKGGDLGKEGGA